MQQAKTKIQNYAEENWYVIWFCANEKMGNNLQFKFYIFETSVDFTMLENRIQNDVTIKVNGGLHSVWYFRCWLACSCCFSKHLILLCINRIDFCRIPYFNKVILSKSEHCSFVSVFSIPVPLRTWRIFVSSVWWFHLYAIEWYKFRLQSLKRSVTNSWKSSVFFNVSNICHKMKTYYASLVLCWAPKVQMSKN